MKNQELKDLTNTFESEANRLNEIINMKERMIDSLNKENSREKQRILELTKNYENEINNLAHDKSRLMNEIDELNKENTALNLKLRDTELLFDRDRANFECLVEKMKDDIEFNQVNFMREKDRNTFLAGDFEKELSHLRSENVTLLNVVNENELLTKEVRNLRELLLERSHEMEKCKEEFIRLGRERDSLVLKIR